MAKDTSEKVFGRFLLKLQESGIDVAELKKEVVSLQLSAEHLNELVEDLRNQNVTLVNEKKQLKTQNDSLSRKVEELEQYSRMSNVEIKGFPCSQGEDCSAIVKMIREKAGCPILPADLDIVYRVPTRSKDKINIIARFCSRTKKSDYISKARKAKLCASDLGITGGTNAPVFINDHLTPSNQVLFFKTLTLKKEKNWMFLWTDNCQIKARKTTNSRVLRIRDDFDLTKID